MAETAPQHNVKQASYPLPQPLTRLLVEVVQNGEAADIETPEEALAQLVGNAFEAMDAMYFAAPANKRKHPAFSHRLCVRVSADPKARTLTVTDLGAGMTRADLINSLGIGRLSRRAHAAAKRLALEDAALEKERVDGAKGDETVNDQSKASYNDVGEEKKDGEVEEKVGLVDGSGREEEDEDEEEEEEDSDSSEEYDEDDFEAEEEGDDAGGPLPCRASDLGGFYSAFVALGSSVKVGTKSAFDDYYEFNISDDFKTFSIARPMEEGTRPTAETGFKGFGDVRGDSGTRVTIQLKDDLGEWTDEAKLRPVFAKIFESSQYTVAFASDADSADIIDASRKEDELMKASKANGENGSQVEEEPVMNGDDEEEFTRTGSHNTVKERSKYIPLRLSLGERKMLRLVESAMTCCDYTTDIDKPFRNDARRTHAQLRGTTAVLRGLVTACDYKAGQKLLENDNYEKYENFFRQMFEIARRHKIMNPEKMRTEYGKLIYLLQDAVSPTVQSHLAISVIGPIESVYKFLEERDGLALLDDRLIEVATEEILAGKKSRAKINGEIKRKEKAVAAIKQRYRNPQLSQEDIHLCLYSICDNNSFLNSNRVPIDKIITYLKKHFNPDESEDGYSLSIVSGTDGARLSHSHERQFYFALQSLTLWRDIVDDMFRLWAMAEADLLSETVTYSLQDTGQGKQRVQQCPRTYKAMQTILGRVQGKVNKWVGSSVIHMGDHNVPNALSFIDKYTQVPRILGPIVICLENLEKLCEEDDGINDMVTDGYGGIEKLRKDILHDFFKSAFDGSGADNFYDAGSCIDGRLTSAWNWCSQLASKPYYPIFKLTGFLGFDGEWKN